MLAVHITWPRYCLDSENYQRGCIQGTIRMLLNMYFSAKRGNPQEQELDIGICENIVRAEMLFSRNFSVQHAVVN